LFSPFAPQESVNAPYGLAAGGAGRTDGAGGVRVFPPWGLDLSRGAPADATVAHGGIGHGGIGHGRRAHGDRGRGRGRIRWDSWSFGRERGGGGAGPSWLGHRGTLSATVAGPRGTVAALTGVTDPAVTVTGTGGTFAISTTGPGDQTLDATVSWACP
jgi:hypothetical protein